MLPCQNKAKPVGGQSKSLLVYDDARNWPWRLSARRARGYAPYEVLQLRCRPPLDDISEVMELGGHSMRRGSRGPIKRVGNSTEPVVTSEGLRMRIHSTNAGDL